MDNPWRVNLPPDLLGLGTDTRKSILSMYSGLFTPEEEGLKKIQLYQQIMANRFTEVINEGIRDPVPKQIRPVDIAVLTGQTNDQNQGQQQSQSASSQVSFQDNKYGVRRNWTGGNPPAPKRSAIAVDMPVPESNVDCTICSRFFPRHVLMPLRPSEHDWREYIRICYTCARNTTQIKTGRPITDQPLISQFLGMAIDNGHGTNSLRADRFPVVKPSRPIEQWTSAVPDDQVIKTECTSKTFNKDRWTLEYEWNSYEQRWYRSIYRPKLDPANEEQEQLAQWHWRKDCQEHWDVRAALKQNVAKRARGVSWKDMLTYFKDLYPDQSNAQRATLGAQRAMILVHSFMDSVEQLPHTHKLLVMSAFSLHAHDCDIMALDIARSLKSIEQDLLGYQYALGFATKIMREINQEWICRNPLCSCLVKAPHWLRNVTGQTTQEIIEQHGQFWCPRCVKMFQPWVDMPECDLNPVEARKLANTGHWNPSRLVPANKAYVVKNTLRIMDRDKGNAAASAIDQDGDEWLVFLTVWPDITIERLIERLKFICSGLANEPPKSKQELANMIYNKAVKDSNQHTVQWTDTVMTPDNVRYLEHRNMQANPDNQVRLDLAKSPTTGQIHYSFIPYKFTSGQTTVMDMDEQIQLWMLIKTSLFSAASAMNRSNL